LRTEHNYKTKGVCSRSIHFIIEDGIISEVSFEGGCDGNAKGIERLVDGLSADDVIKKLKSIKCGYKETSCPDQLAMALEQALKKDENA
jgi:uncharacterized protein (TIGR03905 family)